MCALLNITLETRSICAWYHTTSLNTSGFIFRLRWFFFFCVPQVAAAVDSTEKTVDVGARRSSASHVVGKGKDPRASSVPVYIHAGFECVLLNHANVPFVQQSVLDL